MEFTLDTLKKDEQVSLSLRKLYEQFGYKKYKVSKFEAYELYLENKNFLKSEQIITFNDLDGKLLALKPDVTLSIIKNTNANREQTEKLYYIENVYRLSRQNHEYKEINQMGLEYIGDVDLYATLEVIQLAMDSLTAIDPNCILDISHMGFVSGLFDSLSVEHSVKMQLLGCLRSKNLHDLKRIVEQEHISDFYRDKLEKIAALDGEFESTLQAAQELVINDNMQDAVNELKAIYQIISQNQLAQHIRLDFSIIQDIDYYNGIIFQGYVQKSPSAVLSGGRYDNLLKKFNRDAGAIGFALYLDELSRYYPVAMDYDVDPFVLYQNDADCNILSQQINKLVSSGERVRAGKQIPADLRYKKLMKINGDILEEVDSRA